MAMSESADTSDTHASEQAHTEVHDLKSVLGEFERDLILTALRESRGNKAKAVRALGITERLMGIRVKRLGIDRRGLRTGSSPVLQRIGNDNRTKTTVSLRSNQQSDHQVVLVQTSDIAEPMEYYLFFL